MSIRQKTKLIIMKTESRVNSIINLREKMIKSLNSQLVGIEGKYFKSNNALLTNRLLYKIHFSK